MDNEKKELKKLINEKAITKDGKIFHLEANIGSPKECKQALENSAEGIGLFRTEFLYMDSEN
jgi:phosphotransferase system enzyme I (PtsI)